MSLPEYAPARVVVVVPTLLAGEQLALCLDSLAGQTYSAMEIVVVDNSGDGRAEPVCRARPLVYLRNSRNLGFGAAVNQGFRSSSAPLLATLNDDTQADPGWLAALVRAIQSDPAVGMCASKVLLEDGSLDSAGMLIARDGSSRQRGHGQPEAAWDAPGEALLPSGSAALYRRELLDQTGAFDESFFLYCEDSDLGLRARWAGWRCLYVPEARVRHRYSASAGRASPQKAYLVERNRLRLVVKNFPAGAALLSPLFAAARYGWHLWYVLRGRGKAAEFLQEGHAGWRLVPYVFKAHLDVLTRLPLLLRQRAAARRAVTPGHFSRVLTEYTISVREVAAL